MDINTDELKAAAPIIDYVEKFYSDKIPFVEKSSNCCKGYCIWHKDTESPSLAFFRNGTYKCFGCGKHGDVITLVETIENLQFQEACKLIGDNVGYEVILTPPNPYHENYKDVMDNHSRRYWYNLQMSEFAKEYLMITRGLTKETLDLFRIGLTDVNEYKYRKDMGGISYRISFPILENKIHNPKCIGMGYRTLKDEKPKYINDCNQEGKQNQDPNVAGVFIKGNVLYGYPMAYKAIKEKGYAIVTEGYIDVLSMHQAGLTNTVSIMGTSFTENQVQLIKNMTNSILLILDSDNAGINAMLKILPMLFKYGLNVMICTLQKGMDPADLCLINNFDNKTVSQIIHGNSVSAEKFLIDTSVSKYETYVITERRRIIQNIMPIFDNIEDSRTKDIYIDMLYKRLNMK